MDQSTNSLLDKIAQELPNLQKSQARVANYILEHPKEVTEMRLADLAKNSGVSEPSVIRFCNSIGCSGYQSMKIALARSLAFVQNTSHSEITVDDTNKEIVTKIFDFNIRSLNWAREQLDVGQINSAVDAILAAKQLQFFGFGASGIIAMDAQQKFPLFGRPCSATSDSHQMLISAAMMTSDDVLVAISNTGATREILQAVSIAQSKGAKIIGLTGSIETPLAQRCEYPVIIETMENTDRFTPTVSRVAAVVVIDILSTIVSIQMGDAQLKEISDMKQKLSLFRSTGIV